MKKILLTLITLLAFMTSKSQNYTYLGTYNSLGVPNYLTTSDIIPPSLLARIAASLPEYFPVTVYNPSYISTGTQSNVVMQENGHVWVTFVDEGAGYRNVLGYYSFPTLTPPAVVPANSNLKIIFPNVSKINSGGGLVTGNRVYLGYFTAGTTISWFLVADGFRNGGVTTGNWRLFSNPDFNPEANPSLRSHNVLLYDTTTKKIILGFEDIRRDNASCDNDFNDAIFYVSSTPDTAIATEGMNKTVSPSPNVSSGNNGGLESNGSLSELLSKRYFKRQHVSKLNDLKTQKEANHENASKDRSQIQFVPDLTLVGLNGYVSTPDDLIGVTNAIDMTSMDYYDSLGERQAVLLVTKTENKVYNHTKSICDRLKNASITNISKKEILGYEFITYTMEQSQGNKEYVTCFSLSNHQNQYQIHNQWLISQYPTKDEYFNFQVWSNMPHTNQYIVEKILEKVSAIKPYTVDTVAKHMPLQYFKKGNLLDNEIQFEIVNNTATTQGEIKLSYTESEQDQRRTIVYPIELTPNGTKIVTVPFDNLFDADIQLVINNEPTDEMYLADGAWGVEYPTNSTQIDQFNIQLGQPIHQEGVLTVQRSATVEATIQDYITVYKMLKPSNMSMNVNAYSYLNLTYESTNNVSLRLNKDAITQWNQQGKIQLSNSDTFQSISIPLSQFKNENGESITTDDLVSMSFTTSAIGSNQIGIKVKNVSFSKTPLNELYAEVNGLSVYPNPVAKNNQVQVQFYANETETAFIELISIQGIAQVKMPFNMNKGLNNMTLNLPAQLNTGVYLLQLKHADKIERIKLVIE